MVIEIYYEKNITKMKVSIQVKFDLGENEYTATAKSTVFEWPFTVLPEKGDTMSIDEFEEYCGEFEYYDQKDKHAIQENVFALEKKGFRFIDGEPVIVLYIGDLL